MLQACASMECSETLGKIFLQTIPAIAASEVASEKIRCLLDGGSHRTFISESLSKRLSLPECGTETITVYTFGNENPTITETRKVKLKLSMVDGEEEIIIQALETPTICAAEIHVPSQEIRECMMSKGILLAEATEETGKEIQLLIGTDVYNTVVTGRRQAITPLLYAVETIFGWTVHGASNEQSSDMGVNTICVMKSVVSTETEEELASRELKRFWTLDSIGITDENIDMSEAEIIKNFEETTVYQSERYSVRLPWIEGKTLDNDNFELARKRFISLKKRFVNNPKLYEKYSQVIQEYLETGISEEIKDDERSDRTFYLPHQAVIKEERISTKLRIVFDASAHEQSSLSLNDCLHAGPSMNTDLLKLIITFRKNRIAYTADIEKAFLQIELSEEDRNAVRFLWTENPRSDEVKILRMTRVLFGVSSSPFLLSATIKHHLKRYEQSHPIAVELLGEHMYVDDVIGGADDIDTALKSTVEAKFILSEAGMNLRKFQTNSPALRKLWRDNIPDYEEQREKQSNPSSSSKVLGIKWHPETDVLQFDVSELLKFIAAETNTKRFVLKASSRIFDPVGYLNPFLIRVKCLFQEIWIRGSDWDDPLPSELSEKWRTWCQELVEMDQISIPRWYYANAKNEEIKNKELHIFCDASETAYGAVIYIRFQDAEDYQTRLIASKARVAPLKKVTLPRLELMAAVLGTRLSNHVKGYFETDKPKLHYWTDSTITLSWIQGNPNRWKPFVSNRVREIQENSEPSDWRHCPGSKNPADLITRGQRLSDLVRNETWWNGPVFLQNKFEEKIKNPVRSTDIEIVNSEMRPKEAFQAIGVLEKTPEPIFDITQYSKLNKVIRITAWMRRFVQNAKKGTQKLQGVLTSEELKHSQNYWIKQTQIISFPQEIKDLRQGKEVNGDSKLTTLGPFLDNDGLMRIGGRLQFSDLSYAEKHPLILPASGYFTEMQVMKSHTNVMHGGVAATLTDLRETFWVLRGRQVTKSKIAKCLICRRFAVRPTVAARAPLPRERIIKSTPFETTGIDFAGPVFVKTVSGNDKAYIALFTCAVTRCVHLELVSRLSSDSFNLALRRFFARRGICKIIITDNAKTFKRSEKDLQLIWKTMTSQEVQEFVGERGVKWTYILERSPWRGGFWERLVRSIKSALRKTLGRASLTFEEFETLLIETEAVLNGRPLTYVMNEANEPRPLTPAHFLLTGEANNNLLPSQEFGKESTLKELTKRLKYRQTLSESVWRRWQKEYLCELRNAHQSDKVKSSKELEVGNVVLIAEEKLPRQVWNMARIVETYRGRDGRVRSCSLKKTNGVIIKRPVQLLCNLEINE